MSDDAKPDYTTMSGAEFKRAVGADPEKWAMAFVQRGLSPVFLLEDVAAWFRDAMEAAVKAAGVLVEPWDQQRTVAQILEEGRRQTGKPSE